jgi:hypothetical protein
VGAFGALPPSADFDASEELLQAASASVATDTNGRIILRI